MNKNLLFVSVIVLAVFNSCKTYEGIQLKGDIIGFSDNINTNYKRGKCTIGYLRPKSEPFLLLGDVKYRDGNLLVHEGYRPKSEGKEGLLNMRRFIHDNLEQGDNTALYYAVDNGLDRVKNVQKKYMHKSQKSKYYTIIFTDGLDNISNTKKLGNISGSEDKWHKKYDKKIQKKMERFGRKNSFQSFVLVLFGDDLKKSGYTPENMKVELEKFAQNKDDIIINESTENLKNQFLDAFDTKSFNFEIPKGYLNKQIKMDLRNKELTLATLEGKFEKKLGKYFLTNIKTSNGITFVNQGKKNIRKNRIKMSNVNDKRSTKVLFEINGLCKDKKPFSVLQTKKEDLLPIEKQGSVQYVSKKEIKKKTNVPADGWRYNSEYEPTPTTITDGYILGIIDCSNSMQKYKDEKTGETRNKMDEAKDMMIDIITAISKER